MSNFPSFYEPKRIGTLFYPDVAAIAVAAASADLPPAAEDRQKVHLLIVDMQVDFCHKEGNLYVPGALGDIRRLIEFIYRRAEEITDITCTLDSHLPFQIFHPAWWADGDGNHPEPLTLITHEDVEAGRWRPLVMPDYSAAYVRRLEEQAKKVLTIWPYHVMMGGVGNTLDQELWSAIIWHSLARKSQPAWLTKGRVPQSEHYSAIQPEIPVAGHPWGGRHEALLRALERYDAVLFAGEAESHCVLETVEDVVEAFGDQPGMLHKLYVLRDCTSAVQHPEIDFHALALARFEEFEKKGVNFVDSTEPLPFMERPAMDERRSTEPVAVSGLQRMGEWEMENRQRILTDRK